MAADGKLANLLFVTPDYYEERPKGCMGGWGAIFMSVTPEGMALPCHSARQLPIAFPSVLEHDLQHIWYHSFGLTAIAAMTGCRSPAVPARRKSKTTAAAAVRRSC